MVLPEQAVAIERYATNIINPEGIWTWMVQSTVVTSCCAALLMQCIFHLMYCLSHADIAPKLDLLVGCPMLKRYPEDAVLQT